MQLLKIAKKDRINVRKVGKMNLFSIKQDIKSPEKLEQKIKEIKGEITNIRKDISTIKEDSNKKIEELKKKIKSENQSFDVIMKDYGDAKERLIKETKDFETDRSKSLNRINKDKTNVKNDIELIKNKCNSDSIKKLS